MFQKSVILIPQQCEATNTQSLSRLRRFLLPTSMASFQTNIILGNAESGMNGTEGVLLQIINPFEGDSTIVIIVKLLIYIGCGPLLLKLFLSHQPLTIWRTVLMDLCVHLA